MRRPIYALLIFLFSGSMALADTNVALLIDSLKGDSSFKVRAKAAEIIGKKGDVSSLPALINALQDDENEIVRASAAAAIASLGAATNNADALKALKTAIEKDASSLVRSEAQKALARFPAGVAVGGYMVGDVYVVLGKFTNSTKTADPSLPGHFQKLLDEEFTRGGGKKVASVPSGKKTITVDGAIKKIEAKSAGKSTELYVEVALIITKDKAFVASFEQGGSIAYDGKLSASAESSGRQELLEALVPATYSDLKKNLNRLGK